MTSLPDSSVASPAKDPSRISGMFDAIAERYDLLNFVLSGGLDRSWRARAVRALNLAGHETVLDLCTGTADLALAAGVGARRVIGIDFAGAMLLLGQDKVKRVRSTGSRAVIDLVRGDATCLPLASESIDAVTIGFGIRNVQDAPAACREIVRALRPSGTLVILEFSLPRMAAIRALYLWYFRRILPLIGRMVSKHPSAYTYLPASVEAFPSPEAFMRQLRVAGFSRVEAVPLTLGIVYMFVARKQESGAAPA